MLDKLITYFKANWRTTLIGMIGAVAVAVSSYVSSGGHVTFTGIALTSLLAIAGVIAKDAKSAHLGIMGDLVLKYGESAVTEALQKAIKEQNAKVVAVNSTTGQ